jgi:hypothetical protein
MIEAIVRLRRLAPVMYPVTGDIWLFPSDAPVGHMIEHKEDRSVLSHWGNDLRQTYRTLGQAAGLTDVDMHLLMNHALPGVNAGYITRSKLMQGHLRHQQEKLSSFVLDAVIGRGRRPGVRLSRWLNSASRCLLSDILNEDPDQARRRSPSRSALRKLDVQAARCVAQSLSRTYLESPSRRRQTAV